MTTDSVGRKRRTGFRAVRFIFWDHHSIAVVAALSAIAFFTGDGMMYVLKTFWTWGLSGIVAALPLLIVNQLVPVVMGLFNVWFEKWYPVKLARGRRD